MSTKIVFERKIYDQMVKWKQERNGETALLIQGARRIGKSTIVEDFAKREYKSYILIDFSKVKPEVTRLFEDLSDINYILMRLQIIYSTQLFERKSAIIFDEVQKQPLARQAIKHLVADHRYDYIETGSLISIKSNVKDIIIPSEETRLDMYPMDFEEFRWALGDRVTIPIIKQLFDKREPLGEATHRKLMRDFRLYMLVGGMPQAVIKYLETNNMSEVDQVKRDIIALYEEDMEKLDSRGKSKAIFDSIPSQLSKNESRFKATAAIPNEKPNRLVTTIHDMADSKTINVAYHSNDPNVGLALTKDVERFKLFACDTGLFVTMAFKDNAKTEESIYNKLLNDKLSTNLGYIYENVVAQMLRASGNELYYTTMRKDDGKGYYEVDFILSRGNKLWPIEVKSSGYKTHKSIDIFAQKYSSRIGTKVIIYTKDLCQKGDALYLPVYMTMFL